MLCKKFFFLLLVTSFAISCTPSPPKSGEPQPEPHKKSEKPDPLNPQTRKIYSSETREVWLMNKKEIRWSIDNFESEMTNNLTLSPTQSGLKITKINSIPIIFPRGLKKNDVIHSVNGHSMKTLEDLKKMENDPRNKRSHRINVEIQRSGRNIRLEYRLDKSVPLLALQEQPEPVRLNLPGSTTDEQLAEKLKGVENFNELSLWGCTKITNAGLIHLKGLTNLKLLTLTHTSITDAGLVHLKGLTNLEKLILTNTWITYAGLVHLKGLTNLKLLGLPSTKITNAGLVHLKGLTNLNALGLSYTKITDAGLVHLKGLTNLKTLFLVETKVTVAGFKNLKESLPECRIQW